MPKSVRYINLCPFTQTLLNPNKTVVKIYIVKYDFSDMPPNSHTFIRQKTLSRPTHGSPVPAIPVLHYLIHLRLTINCTDVPNVRVQVNPLSRIVQPMLHSSRTYILDTAIIFLVAMCVHAYFPSNGHRLLFSSEN